MLDPAIRNLFIYTIKPAASEPIDRNRISQKFESLQSSLQKLTHTSLSIARPSTSVNFAYGGGTITSFSTIKKPSFFPLEVGVCIFFGSAACYSQTDGPLSQNQNPVPWVWSRVSLKLFHIEFKRKIISGELRPGSPMG